jgi:hypothetical protein
MPTCSEFPAKVSLTAYIGATFSTTLTWKTGDPAVPVDLTDYTAAMKVKNGESEIIELTSGDGITLGGEDGTIALTISAEDTTDFPGPLVAQYDLLLTSPGDVVTALVAGSFTILKGVTV